MNTITPHYGFVRQITAFEEKNLFLMTELQPLITDKPTSLDIHCPEQSTVDALQMLIMGTMSLSHDQNELRTTLARNPSFEFKKVHSWPVSTLRFGKSHNKANDATSKKLADDWLGVTTMILSLSKEILTRCGYEEFNVLHYQLPVATVHHHPEKGQESFCLSTHKVESNTVKKFFRPASPQDQRLDQCDDKELKRHSGANLGMNIRSDGE